MRADTKYAGHDITATLMDNGQAGEETETTGTTTPRLWIDGVVTPVPEYSTVEEIVHHAQQLIDAQASSIAS